MRYQQLAVTAVVFLLSAPMANAAWFKKDSSLSSPVKSEAKLTAKKQGQTVTQTAQKKTPLVAKTSVGVANRAFIDLDSNTGAPRAGSENDADKSKGVRMSKEEFEKKKKEIEALMASVNSAKGVKSIPSSSAVQGVNAIPHKETYARAKGGSGLTVELGALPKSTVTGTAAGSVAQKPSIPAENVKR